MAVLARYLETNRQKAYDLAMENTKYINNRPVLSAGDEWLEETDWDDLFQAIKEQQEK